MISAPQGSRIIVACATPWGHGALSLVRLSGVGTGEILREVCHLLDGELQARRLRRVDLHDEDGVFDEGMAVWMPGPRSFTGEDSAEITCHGNPLLVDRLLSACVRAGACLAAPGEFTRRAFLNGRMDLTRAESVLQVIEAQSSQGLAVARMGLHGDVARWVDRQRDRIVVATAELEARLDFPGDDLDFGLEADTRLADDLASLARDIRSVACTVAAGERLVRGARVALVGPVNAGKSSLFNAILGRRRALVSDEPGTTRDVLESATVLGGVAVLLMDTAGERSDPGTLEAAGLALRDDLIADADLLVVVLPAHQTDSPDVGALLARTRGTSRILVGNHADRPGAVDRVAESSLLPTCALTGQGVEDLKAAIHGALVGELLGETSLILASRRQQGVLLQVALRLDAARGALLGEAGVAVAAEELHGARCILDEVDGRAAREEVLDAVFARFCIGK